MSNLLLSITDLSVEISHKTLFSQFTTSVFAGNRIAIIGKNGSGKTSLLEILAQKTSNYSGEIIFQQPKFSYVPQHLNNFTELSGGENLIQKLRESFHENPDLILLDEPTNHLDHKNRAFLQRLIGKFHGTIIAVSHDEDFIQNHFDIIWNIANGEIEIFNGNYYDFIRRKELRINELKFELKNLDCKKKILHEKMMKEQEHAKKSKAYGEKKYGNDTLALRSAQGQGQSTMNKNKSRLNSDKKDLIDKLDEIEIPKVIKPKFSIKANRTRSHNMINIDNGSVKYNNKMENILENIFLSVSSGEKLHIKGLNGSGKSTLLKAIADDEKIIKSGNWNIHGDIYYFDQDYSSLNEDETVFQSIEKFMPNGSERDIRKFLSDFLFTQNYEVNNKVKNLSGGEKVRLILAQITCKNPDILLLDEVTNNLDIETKNYVLDVLKEYDGTLIIVSHDEKFIKSLDISGVFEI